MKLSQLGIIVYRILLLKRYGNIMRVVKLNIDQLFAMISTSQTIKKSQI